ncbi:MULTISPECIES: RidA family protein [unclassified Robiginitalea]|uniref:RidA family protein n=1 Tax=Robiginitalea TaxID=252306 RepID=UPI002349D1E9|nr:MULTISPECIES: RidA family protein [unclassified Robiginitalea]MDC6353432.1 RidA family protein [Robiginitalea sp. PM2]MDC6373403.1 RidA family protein [Robiginitalea sp. SP8]
MKRTVWALIALALALSCNGPSNSNETPVDPSAGSGSQSAESGEISNAPDSPDSGYDPEARLADIGIDLPEAATPVANYVNAVRSGNLIFLAGKGPKKADGTYITGQVGTDLTEEEGYEAARLTAINQLAVLKAELGNLDRVVRIVKVHGMVNAAPGFTNQPEVINGFSDLMVAVFGDRGKHARAAVGMGSLPRNISVEVEAVVEVRD